MPSALAPEEDATQTQEAICAGPGEFPTPCPQDHRWTPWSDWTTWCKFFYKGALAGGRAGIFLGSFIFSLQSITLDMKISLP